MHLEIKNLHTYYGLVHMLKGVSLNINEGEIISILGRNGAVLFKRSTCFSFTGKQHFIFFVSHHEL